MIIDKLTLKDLEVFRSDENTATLFDFIDKTKTAGGSYCLRQKFLNPPATFDELKIEQEAVRFFSEMAGSSKLKLPFTSHQMKSLEEYIGSNINVIENESFLTCVMFCMMDIEAYRYIKGGLKEITDFIYTFYDTVHHEEAGNPLVLRRINDELISLLNDPDFREAAGKKNDAIHFWSVLRSDRIFRTRLKKAFQKILEWFYEVDALISMAITTEEQNFCFPDIINDNDPSFEVEGLYHPLLPNAVPNDINITGISNFVFLTGPNMAGKTTFLKASGIAVYLAHLGMGIPARSARISYFDRLLTSLNITDSIASGYSFFYSEVLRVKQLAENLKNGEKTFSIFDELFRGTNVKDAFDASQMIISGLVRWKTSIFILSSHLWELWGHIKNNSNIRELCFESDILDGKPVFSYRLFHGVSDMRLGLTILENEKIMDLLNSTKDVKD